jgi:hypothetical protein
MRHVTRLLIFCFVAISLIRCAVGVDQQKESLFQQQIKPLLKQYCYDCHDAGNSEGDFNLEAFKSSRLVLENRSTWLKLMQRVSFGDMPPDDAEAMPEDHRAKLLQAIDELINKSDCTQQIDPGHVTIRRLNRFEYLNTVRDLLNVEYTPARDFPGDDVGYGFDNIGDVLSLPPLLMEKYLAAAEEISYEAIPDGSAQKYDLQLVIKGSEFSGDKKSSSNGDRNEKVIFSDGQVDARFRAPADGKYTMKLFVYGELAGKESPKFSFELDGKERRRLSVDEPKSSPRELEMEFDLEKGEHSISVAFLNDFYDADAKDKTRRDRNLGVLRFEVAGPIDQQQELASPVMFVQPNSPEDYRDVSYRILQRLASRAYRRPAKEEEIKRLQLLVAMVVKDGGNFEDGIRLALQAVLVSPHFLYKVETPPPGNEVREINEYELAASLSYFIWNSMPDDTLFLASFRQQLRQGNELQLQIDRMLKDAKAQAMIENFGMQWLQLRTLKDAEPDKGSFPQFDDELRAAMRTETELLLREIVKNDLSILTLLTADFTFVNEKLANHYELLNVKGPEFRKVSLIGSPRRGLLSHASILTITSNPTRTSPVKRGKWVLENLLGAPPPPPAPDVMPLDDQQLTGTLREQMKQHRENPACASCHAEMDPIGFALENFDAVGRWREKESGIRIDPSGTLPDGTAFQGPAELQAILSQARRDNFVRCFAEKMLTYALGRGLDYYDQCAVDKIVKQAAQQDYRYSAFVKAVVLSEPFQKRRNRESENDS